MKTGLFLALSLAGTLSGCAQDQINRTCAIGEVAGKTLAQILTDLQAAGVHGPLADKLALGLFLGQTTRSAVCSVIASPPPPVAVPGG